MTTPRRKGLVGGAVDHHVDPMTEPGQDAVRAVCGWDGPRIVGPSLWTLSRARCSKCVAGLRALMGAGEPMKGEIR